ncbi:MAG: hypothetical protein ABSG23_03100 [Terriglobales bacterium]|jgi:hypothetical protein
MSENGCGDNGSSGDDTTTCDLTDPSCNLPQPPCDQSDPNCGQQNDNNNPPISCSSGDGSGDGTLFSGGTDPTGPDDPTSAIARRFGTFGHGRFHAVEQNQSGAPQNSSSNNQQNSCSTNNNNQLTQLLQAQETIDVLASTALARYG